MEKKKKGSISGKMLAGMVILAFAIAVVSCVAGYFQYRNTIYKLYNENGYVVGDIILDQIDNDKIAEYARTWTEDSYYSEMTEYLKNVEEASGAAYIYMIIPGDDGNMRYIYDSSGCKLGDSESMSASGSDKLINVYKTGERTDYYFVRKSKKYGYLTSSVLPVVDSNNNVCAILLVDTHMEVIVSTLMSYIIKSAIICILILIIFSYVDYRFMKKSIIQPVDLIKEKAGEFSQNATEITAELNDIKTGDELEDLSKAILTMESDIIKYVDDLTKVTAEKERVGAELNVATQIQKSMLPCIFPAFPERKEIDIYATMNPAKEVGGDFYDFFMVDDTHLAIVMADVSGKGVPAALFMVIGKTLIKDHTTPGRDLGDIFTEVNNLLCESDSEGLFITAFEGVLDLETGRFDFVNAGHELPFICKKGDKYAPYKVKRALVLAGMEDMNYKSGTMQLEPGDKLFQYTDGVTEATNASFELYGMDRLEEVLNKNINCAPTELLPAVKKDIDEFVGEAPQFDDITMLCLEFKGYMNK